MSNSRTRGYSSRPEPPPTYSEKDKGNEVSLFESSSDLIIGIDFGTTYTGVAYAHTAGILGNAENMTTMDMKRAAEKIHVIRTWPNQSNYFAEKTPSIIAYHTSPPTWGAKVKAKDKPQVAHFKLGLQENLGEHYFKKSLPNATPSILGGYLSNHNWRHEDFPHKEAVDYVGDYLKCVRDHVLKEILPSRYGEQFLKNQQTSYVLTVPAIWSDKAKELTRKAAITAGIPAKKLMLISEPEAAALFCATLCPEADLHKGDRFLICDAGGGTVVCPHLRKLT
jgi:molecular chaperone DnaK (HSP70)